MGAILPAASQQRVQFATYPTEKRYNRSRIVNLFARNGAEMSTTTLKEEAKRLVDELPEGATWEDLMYRIYVRQAIEAGLADSDSGNTVDVEEVRAEFGLPR